MAKIIIESLKHKQYKLPGLQNSSFTYKLLPDIIFFMVVVALPSSFFALIPDTFFFDLRIVFFTCSILYLIIYLKNIKKIGKLPGGIAFITLCGFLIWQIAYSLLSKDIPFVEVITVFRANFFYPLSALGFLLYVIEMDIIRINRFMYWLLITTFIQGILYIISNIFNINIFAFGALEYEYEGAILLQNMSAIPHYNEILFAFTFASTLFLKKYNKHYFWAIPLIVTIISIVRSQMIVYSVLMFLILLLAKISKTKINFSKFLKILLLGILFLVLILYLFPSHIGGVVTRFGLDNQEKISQKKYLEEGTFYLRLELIKDSYNRTKSNNNLFMGNGYIREARKGEADFVIGGDTLIAPVIYTEGFIGLFLRILPIIILVIYFFKLLFIKINKFNLFAVVSIALVLPEIVNLVQTKFFVYYTREIFILFILTIVIQKINKIKPKK